MAGIILCLARPKNACGKPIDLSRRAKHDFNGTSFEIIHDVRSPIQAARFKNTEIPEHFFASDKYIGRNATGVGFGGAAHLGASFRNQGWYFAKRASSGELVYGTLCRGWSQDQLTKLSNLPPKVPSFKPVGRDQAPTTDLREPSYYRHRG
jgi:hypothetical protein